VAEFEQKSSIVVLEFSYICMPLASLGYSSGQAYASGLVDKKEERRKNFFGRRNA